MTPELIALTLAALLQYLQFTLYAVPANRDLGVGEMVEGCGSVPCAMQGWTIGRVGSYSPALCHSKIWDYPSRC